MPVFLCLSAKENLIKRTRNQCKVIKGNKKRNFLCCQIHKEEENNNFVKIKRFVFLRYNRKQQVGYKMRLLFVASHSSVCLCVYRLWFMRVM